jgi:hypothetical protein
MNLLSKKARNGFAQNDELQWKAQCSSETISKERETSPSEPSMAVE